MDTKLKLRRKFKHILSCEGNGEWFAQSHIQWFNAIGRGALGDKKTATHRWIILECDDIDCPAQILINVDSLERLVKLQINKKKGKK